ncbi:MAG: hypothetical protein H0Z24_03420 [Thermosipho sp. (in: Bacteria)]|nr:hypothetical protein [Thermosipho sp. (in: thermotogales)]
MGSEIERKFLVKDMPLQLIEQCVSKVQIIDQFYLAYGQEEIRIRRVETTYSCDDKENIEYYMTHKAGLGLNRMENEITIKPQTFNQLKRFGGKPVRKIRMVCPEFSIDIFLTPSFLVVAEIEFDNDKQAKEFEPWDWLGEEVTEKPEYSSQGQWRIVNNIPL